MADPVLDVDVLGRDRQRYAALLQQAHQQVATWKERAEHLQHALDALGALLDLAGGEGAGPAATTAPRPGSSEGASREKAAPTTPGRRRAPTAAGAPPPTATPAAPDPVEPPARPPADPRGTDALRLVLESEPRRTWALSELIDALNARGWLTSSRRPEEGVRISMKRLVERGGAVRTGDGRWHLPGAEPSQADGPAEPMPGDEPAHQADLWPEADPPVAPGAPSAEAAPAADPPAAPPAPPPARPRPASFGRPVGATVTEL